MKILRQTIQISRLMIMEGQIPQRLAVQHICIHPNFNHMKFLAFRRWALDLSFDCSRRLFPTKKPEMPLRKPVAPVSSSALALPRLLLGVWSPEGAGWLGSGSLLAGDMAASCASAIILLFLSYLSVSRWLSAVSLLLLACLSSERVCSRGER